MNQTTHKPHRDVKPEKGIQDQGPEDTPDKSDTTPARLPDKPRGATTDKEELFRLRSMRGFSVRKIAQILGIPKSTVHDDLVRYNIPSDRELEAFKDTRADRFAAIQRDISSSIGQDDYKKATLVQKTTAIGTLYDKERLERGQSTGNIALSIDDMSIADQAALRKLADKLPEMILESEPVKEGTR